MPQTSWISAFWISKKKAKAQIHAAEFNRNSHNSEKIAGRLSAFWPETHSDAQWKKRSGHWGPLFIFSIK